MTEELKKTTGSISISYDVTCPHCGELFFNDSRRERWDKMFGENTWEGMERYGCDDVECPECHGHFDVTGFEY